MNDRPPALVPQMPAWWTTPLIRKYQRQLRELATSYGLEYREPNDFSDGRPSILHEVEDGHGVTSGFRGSLAHPLDLDYDGEEHIYFRGLSILVWGVLDSPTAVEVKQRFSRLLKAMRRDVWIEWHTYYIKTVVLPILEESGFSINFLGPGEE